MYSDSLCFRNSSCSTSFFVAFLAYVHCITFAVHSSFFFLDLYHFFLPGDPNSLRSSFLKWIFLNLKTKLILPKTQGLSKLPSSGHSLSNFRLKVITKNLKFYKTFIPQSALNICRIKKKHINVEQYDRLRLDDQKMAICETTSDALLIIDTSFTTKDHYFKHALSEACEAFNATMKDFAYTQRLQQYDLAVHQFHAPQQHPLNGWK